MKKTLVLLLMLTLLIGLCACSSEDPAPTQPDPALVEFCTGVFHTPQDECELEDIMELYPDGTCSVSNYTWAISGDVLNLTVSQPDGARKIYGFAIDTDDGTLKALFANHVFYYKG